MLKIKVILLSSVLLYLVACQNEGAKEVESVFIEELQSFDTLAYLEQFNTEDIIYENTESYEIIIDSHAILNFNRTNKTELAYEWTNRRKDTVFSSIQNDTLVITNVMHKHGECPWYLIYLQHDKGNTSIKMPNSYIDEFTVYGVDTVLADNGCCSVAGWEFNIFIPLSKLEKTEHLYFKGQVIKFY